MPAQRDPLAALEALRTTFGAGAEPRKRKLLDRLARALIAGAERLRRYHETLLFLRAWPDSPAVLEAAEAGLAGFSGRVAGAGPTAFATLDEQGMAATSIYCAFSLPVAAWLTARFPGDVSLYDADEDMLARLDEALPSLLLPAEAEAAADGYLDALGWLAAAGRAADRPTDLRRLVAMFAALPADERIRAALWSAIGVTVRWDLARGPGSRTLARAPAGDITFQTTPLERGPVDLRVPGVDGSGDAPAALELLQPALARRWIELARVATASRLREVWTFTHASEHDMSLASPGDGLRVAFFGVAPPARHALRAFYGYLVVHNDVPVGYGDAVLLGEWGEINFHIFETFRSTSSSRIYAAVLSLFRTHFGVRYLFLNRYQFGWHNPDAIASGAFWFYEKLGFRPEGGAERALWREERAHLARDPHHRSSPEVLERLALGHMGLALTGPRAEIERRWRGFHPGRIGFAVTRAVERFAPGDRAAAAAERWDRVSEVFAGLWRGAAADALGALAPILDLIPDLASWSLAERQALHRVVRAKAGPREIEYLRLTREHLRFRDALLAIAREGGGREGGSAKLR